MTSKSLLQVSIRFHTLCFAALATYLPTQSTPPWLKTSEFRFCLLWGGGRSISYGEICGGGDLRRRWEIKKKGGSGLSGGKIVTVRERGMGGVPVFSSLLMWLEGGIGGGRMMVGRKASCWLTYVATTMIRCRLGTHHAQDLTRVVLRS
jgi:hypothetical protein